MHAPVRNTLRAALVAAAISMASTGRVSAQAYQWQSPLAPTDAIQAVRNFEGNQTLAVTILQSPLPNSGGPAPGYIYQLSAGNYQYYLCEYTPTQIGLRNTQDEISFYGPTYDPRVPPGTLLTQSQCQSIAQNFMQSHYPDPTVLGSPSVSSESTVGDGGWIREYYFTYRQMLAPQTIAHRSCWVGVDTVYGEVINYFQCYYPVNVSLTPGLTSDQAAASAAAALQLTGASVAKVDGLAVCSPDPFGWDQLAYWLYMIGQGPNDLYPTMYQVTVDANSGQVMDYGITMKGGLKTPPKGKRLPHPVPNHFLAVSWGSKPVTLAHPPVLIHGTPYFWIGYLHNNTALKVVRKVGHLSYVSLEIAGRAMRKKISYRRKDRTIMIR